MLSDNQNTNIMIEALKGFVSGLDDSEKIRVTKYLGLPVNEEFAPKKVKTLSIPALNMNLVQIEEMIVKDHNKAVEKRKNMAS